MENRSIAADKEEMTLPTESVGDFFAQLPIALYRSSADGELLTCNEALAKLLGFDSVAKLLEGLSTVDTLYAMPSQRSTWLETIRRAGVVHDFDVQLQRSDGSTIWVQDTARAVYDEDGSFLYCEGALVDVTEKVRAKKARDVFIATVSHELRNPIAVILGMGQILDKDYDNLTDKERREMAASMAAQAEDASWIIEDLLVAYRGDGGEVSIVAEPFDVLGAVEATAATPEIEVEVVVPEDLKVHADPRRTRQILRNLVSNAARYGGEDVVITAQQEGDVVEIHVSDNGPPLPEEVAEKIFEPYERGPDAVSNSVGLGLAVARHLAGKMAGSLTYRHDGEWARFVLALPSAR